MKTKSVQELFILSEGLLLLLSLWIATPNALESAAGLTRFSLSDGDNVTCYPIQDQQSLNGSKIYNRYPTTEIISGNYTNDTHGAKRTLQTMTVEAGACPNGTIPIRAPRGVWDDHEIGRRMPEKWHSLQANEDYLAPPHEYGIALTDQQANATYKGTEVFINVWKPHVESTYEFSLAQLWLISGENTIEAGYQVSQGHYGDGLPRLFVYWTADGYQKTGCYDLSCNGFVQVSNKVLIGGSFTAISSQSGQQYEIKLRVFKDDGTGDWWLQLNDENVGYWPKDIYNVTTPFDLADTINWGAEIVDDEPDDGGTHTYTEMGSGKFANEGYGRAAYQRNLQQINLDNTLVDVPIFLSNSESQCYSVAKGETFGDWGSYFFYGGPGRGPLCLHDPAYPPPPQSGPSPAPMPGGVL